MPEVGMRLTKAGTEVLAKGLLGKEIRFSRVALGSGEFSYDEESVFDLTEMREEKMTLPIESIRKTGDGTITITAHKTNAELVEGFCAREHGVFCLDPDTGKEILYSYRNCGENYTYLPSNTGAVHKDVRMSYVIVVRDAENITALLDLTFAYVSQSEYAAHVNAAHPHLNTPNHYLDIKEASELWAADNDNHLHKIKLEDLKRQLAQEQEAAEVIDAGDLGLDANVLMFDDDGSFTDIFKVRVTSSAESGLLLGVESVTGIRQGAFYTISDGVNSEPVQIASVRFNQSGYHCKLAGRLDNSYDWNATYLYRTAHASDRAAIVWEGGEFGGREANFPRDVELDFQGALIIGTGFINDKQFILG